MHIGKYIVPRKQDKLAGNIYVSEARKRHNGTIYIKLLLDSQGSSNEKRCGMTHE